MKLKQSLLIAIVLSIIGLTAWELHWRSQPDYYKAFVNDDRYLWAAHRAKVETATDQDIVIIGASRTGFNFNTHVWKEVQGIKPINLSTNGKPAGPFLEDIVRNTKFKGTLIIGVTPLLWFTDNENQRSIGAQKWVNHYHKQTYAQELGYFLSKPLQRNLVMLTSSELDFYNDLDLKALLNTINIDGRIPTGGKLLNFGYNDEDRNLIMFSSMVSNPDFAKKISNVWNGFLPTLPDYEIVKDFIPKVIEDQATLINAFKARGGKVIFVHHESESAWYANSNRMLPRDKVWDRFIKTVDCPSYHFEDYEFMSKYTLPEWSHMNAEDSKTYTRDMVNQLIKDKHLHKTNNH